MGEVPNLTAAMTGGKPINIMNYDGRDIVLPAGLPLSYIYGFGSADGKWIYRIDGGLLHKVPNPNYIPPIANGGGSATGSATPEIDKRAGFLEQVRASGRAGKVIAKLQSDPDNWNDNAKKTMFFNPLVLNDGIIPMISRGDFDASVSGASVRALRDGDNTGAAVRLGAVEGDWSFGLDGYFGRNRADTEYKYGTADVWGAGARIQYDWLSAGAKYFAADWAAVAIMNDAGGVDTRAKSRFFYGFLEAAPVFFGAVQPVIRANLLADEIADASRRRVFATYGGRMFFDDKSMSVAARYGVFAMSEIDGFDAGAFADWHFSDDGFLVSARAGLRRISLELGLSF
jgi:hypothetical protein